MKKSMPKKFNKCNGCSSVFLGQKSLSIGRSMIEMLGVLAVVGLLSIGGLYAYRQAMIRHQNNALISGIGYGVIAVQTLCGENYTYTCPIFWNSATNTANTRSMMTTRVCSEVPECQMINAAVGHFEGTFFVGWQIYSNFENIPQFVYRFFLTGVQKSSCKQIVATHWSELHSMHVRVDDPTFPYKTYGVYAYKTKQINASFTEEDNKVLNAACDYIDGQTDVILSFYLQ